MDNEWVLSEDARNYKQEVEYWTEQMKAFRFHPKNPRAPQDSPERESWGIPKHLRPPTDAYQFIYSAFRRNVAQVPETTRLSPKTEYLLWTALAGHFLWFTVLPKKNSATNKPRTPSGVPWVLALHGVEEISPFVEAYAYYFLDKQQQKILIDASNYSSLRIFERCKHKLLPPIDNPSGGPVYGEIERLLEDVRDPYARHSLELPPPDLMHYVSRGLKKWFEIGGTDDEATTTTRQWAYQLVNSRGKPFFPAIHWIKKFRTRAYRIQATNPQTGEVGIRWCGPDRIYIQSRFDFDLQEGAPKQEVERRYTCTSCRKVRTCVPATGEMRLCANCMGTTHEPAPDPRSPAYRLSATDSRDMLDLCSMTECYRCPAHISSKWELNELKNRLRRKPGNPVRRTA